MTNAKLTLASPEVIKAASAACIGEDAAKEKWVKLASYLVMAGVTYDALRDEDGETYKSVYSMVVSVQKPHIVTLLTASSLIGFTDSERTERKIAKGNVGLYMTRIKTHVKKFELENSGNAADRKTFGETLARDCQEMIDRIRRAKEERLDFDAPEAIVALKELKAIFLA
jgi:hypothetical protein